MAAASALVAGRIEELMEGGVEENSVAHSVTKLQASGLPSGRLPTARALPLQRRLDLLQRIRILDGRQVARITAFANGLYRAPQQLAGTRLRQQADEVHTRRPPDCADLLVDYAHDFRLQCLATFRVGNAVDIGRAS